MWFQYFTVGAIEAVEGAIEAVEFILEIMVLIQ